MKKEHYYIDTHGNDDDAYREAISFACDLINKDSSISKITLLIETKQNIAWFERIYDAAIVKKLFTGVRLDNCDTLIKFEILKTYSDSYKLSEIVITCGLDESDIIKIEDYHSIKAVIAIPWLNDRIKKWVQTYSPKELRGNQQAVAAYPLPTCVVQKAMIDLSHNINMSTGIHHFKDEERAKTYILALHKYEETLDSNVVSAYLVKVLAWPAKRASDVQKLIDTLNAGKFFKGGQRTGLQHYYKDWKNNVKNNC